jgi:putative oxidoreductase
MSSGLPLLRIAVGSIMAAHGAQKLFGWRGGPGISGTAILVSFLTLIVGRRRATVAEAPA